MRPVSPLAFSLRERARNLSSVFFLHSGAGDCAHTKERSAVELVRTIGRRGLPVVKPAFPPRCECILRGAPSLPGFISQTSDQTAIDPDQRVRQSPVAISAGSPPQFSIAANACDGKGGAMPTRISWAGVDSSALSAAFSSAQAWSWFRLAGKGDWSCGGRGRHRAKDLHAFRFGIDGPPSARGLGYGLPKHPADTAQIADRAHGRGRFGRHQGEVAETG